MHLFVVVQMEVQRNQRRAFFRISLLCPPEWTLDSSPLSLQKTEKLSEASRNCGGSESTPVSHPVFSTLSSANALQLCIDHAGFDAASPAAPLRSTTLNWAISKEEASDLQPVPDWPDQQTRGNGPTLIPHVLTCGHSIHCLFDVHLLLILLALSET